MKETKTIASPVTLTKSEREIVARLFGSDPIPRAALTEQTSLSQQSVHRLLEGLKARGFVRFGEPVVSGRGKPSPTVEIDPHRYATLGLSVTTEAVSVAVLDLKGGIVLQYDSDACPNDPDAVLAALDRDLTNRSLGALEGRNIIGIGVAMQGYRTGDFQRFKTPARLDRWADIPIARTFENRLGLPILVENNATASALAEHYLGAGRGHDSIVYLSFNYGFGGGTVVKGAPLVGQRGNAGELSGLFDAAEMAHRPALGELLKRLQGRGQPLSTVAELVATYDRDTPGVQEWIDEVRPSLGLIVRALKVILDPGAICFGGEAPPALRRGLIDAVRGDLGASVTPDPILVESTIEGDAARYGAAFLPLRALIFE